MAKRGFTGAMTRAYGARDHDVTVTAIEQIAPHFKRIWMSAPSLIAEVAVGPTAYLRFWFPDAETGIEYQRAYTLTQVDEQSGTFAVDVVIHEPTGPAAAWAAAAVPGSTVQANALGSTRFEVASEPPAGYLLIGDAASIPAINAIVAAVPADIPVEVYLEQRHDADRLIPLTEHPRASVHWVPRAGEASLAAAVEARDWSDWYTWAAPESGSLKHLRARLRDEFGFPKSEVHAQAYGYYGRAFGKSRSKADPEPLPPAAAVAESAAAAGPAHRQAPPAQAGASPGRGAWRSQAGSRLLAPLKTTMVLSGVAQALVTLVQLAPFVLLVELSRLLIAGAPPERFWGVGLWAVGLMGAGVLLATAVLVWLHWVDARFARDLRQRLLRKLSTLPLGWFDTRGSGQVKQLVQDDTLALHYLVTHAVPDAVNAVVAPVAVLAYLFVADWRIALLLLIPVIAYIVGMAIMLVQSGARTAEASRWSERMNDEAGAYLEGQPVVRVFGGAAASSFRARLAEYTGFLELWQRPLSGQKAFIDLATRPATFLLLICAAGTLFIATGLMQPLALLPFLLLGTTFGARLLGIGYGLSGLRAGLLAARRIQVALDEPELAMSVADPLRMAERELPASEHHAAADGGSPPPGTVSFDGVGFAYRPGVPVLADVSLTLAPGTVTALVGPSGSGKSTLASLLARFNDVTAGAIRIGGSDLRDLTADELYGRVGFVFQDAQLVHGTVRENIALAAPGADDAAVEAAARAAQIHERILRLSDGYQTVLGPDAALSGGERQRLTIARAILADTPVLVLDEATAFADPESEYLVQRALTELTAGRTVLVIAHRLHTITGADRIVVLDRGRIAQSGTHTELLAAGGRYRQLWEAGIAPGDAPGGDSSTRAGVDSTLTDLLPEAIR
ncbi:ATP-binding cassette domain-containing protein [Nonlabens tegetincola]